MSDVYFVLVDLHVIELQLKSFYIVYFRYLILHFLFSSQECELSSIVYIIIGVVLSGKYLQNKWIFWGFFAASENAQFIHSKC